MTTTNLSKQDKAKQAEVIEICKNNRELINRIPALRAAGFFVNECPMPTGGGIGNVKVMRDGSIRCRVSANWGSKFGNYAYCVTL